LASTQDEQPNKGGAHEVEYRIRNAQPFARRKKEGKEIDQKPNPGELPPDASAFDRSAR